MVGVLGNVILGSGAGVLGSEGLVEANEADMYATADSSFEIFSSKYCFLAWIYFLFSSLPCWTF